MDIQSYLYAFGITLFAGLATGVGGILSLIAKDMRRFLPVSLGLSAGVMIYVSFVELFQEARSVLVAQYAHTGEVLTVLGFFIGITIIFIVDQLIPENINPHESPKTRNRVNEDERQKAQLKRVGLIAALGIVIHNFPEGIATFASGLQGRETGLVIAVAVAIHNIPEGIAVAAPIYQATKSRKKAVWLAFASGLAEPAGALVGMAILAPFLNDTLFGMMMAAVAGIMVFISLDELLPTAQAYGEHHLSIFGLILGMAVMALSLLLLK